MNKVIPYMLRLWCRLFLNWWEQFVLFEGWYFLVLPQVNLEYTGPEHLLEFNSVTWSYKSPYGLPKYYDTIIDAIHKLGGTFMY